VESPFEFQPSAQLRGTEELRKRGTSRLWYRQTEEEPVDPVIPATYRARSTSLLSPDVVTRYEEAEALVQLFA
jgi:hypothetical protein